MFGSTKAEVDPTGPVTADGDNSTKPDPSPCPEIRSRDVFLFVRSPFERAIAMGVARYAV